MNDYIGIDLGGTTIKGGRIRNQELIETNNLPVNKSGDAETIFNEICLVIESLLSSKTEGIGFAVPALINTDAGIIYGLSNIEPLNDFPIQKRLTERFKIPVILQNDANCFVLGEKYFGRAKGYNNIVGLITGTGVGAGIIINEQLYAGQNSGSGEFGMISYLDKNFEKYCSGQFFIDNYGLAGEILAGNARQGDLDARAAFDLYGKHLSELIKLICYAMDPEIIIIGGSVSRSFDLYENSMYKSLESYYFETHNPVKILPSVNHEIAIYGAVSLFFTRGQI